jgi:CelD/BcsL family acetyltransferase involved in cellulose biosynthesis
LQDPKNREFFGRLVPLLAEKGWLQLAFLRVDGQYAAGYLDFIYGDEVLVYNSGLNLSVAPELSPGILLLAYLIRHAIEQGCKRFDFLRGNEEYKYRLGGRDTKVYMLIATHAPGSIPI